MTNSETKNFSQNVSSSYHLEDRDKCNKNTCANTCNVPKLRFKGYNYNYDKITLKNISTRIKRVNSDSTAPIMMISANCGFIMQSEKYSRDNAGKSLTKYTIIHKGELAYNHGASKAKPYGCCFQIDVDEARIPYVYHCFKIDKNNYAPYIALYLNNKLLERELRKLVSSSVRMDGLLNISYEDYTNIKLNLPRYEEQKKIASFLTLIDKKIEKQKELVELLKKYKRGLLSAIFSQKLRFKDDNGNDYPAWEEKRLGDICKTFSGGTPSVTNSEYYNGEIPFIKSGEIHSDRTEMFITVEGLENSSAKLVNKGDLLYALYGATSGEVDISKIDGAINQAILCVKSDTLVLNYLKELLSYNKNRILCKYLQGGQGNLSADIFKALKFYFPLKEEQNKISDLLISYDKTIKIEEHLLNYYVSYKQGLLQQLFI